MKNETTKKYQVVAAMTAGGGLMMSLVFWWQPINALIGTAAMIVAFAVYYSMLRLLPSASAHTVAQIRSGDLKIDIIVQGSPWSNKHSDTLARAITGIVVQAYTSGIAPTSTSLPVDAPLVAEDATISAAEPATTAAVVSEVVESSIDASHYDTFLDSLPWKPGTCSITGDSVEETYVVPASEQGEPQRMSREVIEDLPELVEILRLTPARKGEKLDVQEDAAAAHVVAVHQDLVADKLHTSS